MYPSPVLVRDAELDVGARPYSDRPQFRVRGWSGQDFGVGLEIIKCTKTDLIIRLPGFQAPVSRGI